MMLREARRKIHRKHTRKIKTETRKDRATAKDHAIYSSDLSFGMAFFG